MKLKKILPLLVITSITIFILYSSFTNSGMYQTHDAEFHLIRAMHFKNELLHGQFPIRIAPDQAYLFGYPTFNFFYPLPYYVIAMFQFSGFSTVTSWKLMQVLVTFSSIYIFYLWMKKHFDTKPALTASIVYALAPFRIVMIYVSSQLGGYFSFLFIPIIGLGLFNILNYSKPYSLKNKKLNSKKIKSNGVLLSLGIAGLITSHLLSVIIFFIPLLGYTFYLFYKIKLSTTLDSKTFLYKIKQLLFWSVLGIGLSSFYFLPFMLEKHWVNLGRSILINHRDHWPTLKQLIYSPWGYGSSVTGSNDTMSFQIGFAILLSWIVSILIILKQKKKIFKVANLTNFKKFISSFVLIKNNLFGITFIIIFSFLVFLLTSTSSFFWEIFQPLQYIQFPWRLLAATSLVGAILVGWSTQQFKGKTKKSNFKQNIYILLLVSLAIYNVRNYVHSWPLNWRNDTDYMSHKNFYGETDISWELMPITATKTPTRVPELITKATSSGITVTKIEQPSKGNIRKIIYIDSTKSALLNLSIWDLPVWEIKVNGNLVEKGQSDTGTILVPITKDTKTIQVILKKTNVQIIAEIISVFSILLLLVIFHFHKTKSKL